MDTIDTMDKEELFEIEHVHRVYDRIAEGFSKTRFNVWPSVKKFLDGIPIDDTEDIEDSGIQGVKVLEVGSGNGKNLIYLENVKNKMGCDMSTKFVSEVRANGIECI